jgi:hypothetical protein
MSSKFIFRNGDAVDEIIAAMQSNLTSVALNKTASSNFDKLAYATDLLNDAAQILDHNGLSSEADDITKMLEELANG